MESQIEPIKALETESLGAAYQDLFAILRGSGFDLIVEDFAPQSFGNFVVMCRRTDVVLRATNDRGQIFIQVKMSTGEWRDKESILEAKGIARSRHGKVNGLWVGYEPDVQAADLRAYLPLLISAASAGAA